MKAIERIKAHPAVEDVSDERFLGDGCWVALKDGWRSRAMDCQTIHEDTWAKCWKVMMEGIERVAS